jgi:hypothetical protein
MSSSTTISGRSAASASSSRRTAQCDPLGRDLAELVGSEQAPRRGAHVLAEELAQDLDQRPVRDPLAVGQAATEHGHGPIAEHGRHLAHEP